MARYTWLFDDTDGNQHACPSTYQTPNQAQKEMEQYSAQHDVTIAESWVETTEGELTLHNGI